MSKVSVTKDKLDILANAIANKSGEPLTLTLDEMVSAVDGIQVGGGGGSVTQDQDGYIILPPDGSGGGGSSDFFTQYNVEVKVTEYSVSKPPLFLEGVVLSDYENLDDGVLLTLDGLAVRGEFNDEQIANIPVLAGNLGTSIENFAINIDGGAGDIAEITTDGNVTYDSEEQFFAVTGDGKIFVKLNIE